MNHRCRSVHVWHMFSRDLTVLPRDPLRTRAIPEYFCGDDSLRRGDVIYRHYIQLFSISIQVYLEKWPPKWCVCLCVVSSLLTQHTYVVPTFHYVDLNNSDRDHQVFPASLEMLVSGSPVKTTEFKQNKQIHTIQICCLFNRYRVTFYK